MNEATRLIMLSLDKLQVMLDFGGCENPQFKKSGIGKIGTASFILGILFGFNTCLSIIACFAVYFTKSSLFLIFGVWSIYTTFLTGFHFLEFFITAIRQPDNVSYDSFVISHSKAYTIAAIISAMEYWLESIILGRNKFHITFIILGVVILIGGQYIRSLAMWTCGTSFSHIIKDKKTHTHQLITHGVYAYLRHPSYFGWFYWSIGTQLLLCNPISFICYTYASWRFFADRIPYEEELLYEFYGQSYLDYIRSTYIGIPFITSNINKNCKNKSNSNNNNGSNNNYNNNNNNNNNRSSSSSSGSSNISISSNISNSSSSSSNITSSSSSSGSDNIGSNTTTTTPTSNIKSIVKKSS